MSDHSLSALSLVWNEEGAWDTTLRQLRYWRIEKKEFTRLTAVIDTRTGQPALLNYYGYALFFYHTITAWTGQTASLPARSLRFAPHYSAFDASGGALLPIILGGALGTLALTPTSATFSMAFVGGPQGSVPLSFLNITVCQHSFTGTEESPFLLLLGASLELALPAPCDRASPASVSRLVTRQFCALGPSVSNTSAVWSQQPLPTAVPGLASLAACQAFSLQHYYCGYEWDGTNCFAIPGAACYIVESQQRTSNNTARALVGAINRTLGFVLCNYSDAYSPLVNASTTARFQGLAFGQGFVPLDSAVYSFVAPGLEFCAARAAALQMCGWLWIDEWAGGGLGSCSGDSRGCCLLDPYKGCGPGGPVPPAWGSNATLGIFEMPGQR